MNGSTPDQNLGPSVAALVAELKARYPNECAHYDDSRLTQMMAQSLETCPNLEITEQSDIFRYAALRVLLTDEQRRSPLIRGTLIRTLSNFGWDAHHRLEFIYKHIVGRPVSQNEEDFGALFVPPAKLMN